MTDTTEDRWRMERLVRERRKSARIAPVTQDEIDRLRGWREITKEDIRAMIINHQGWDPGDMDPMKVENLTEADKPFLSRIKRHKFKVDLSDVWDRELTAKPAAPLLGQVRLIEPEPRQFRWTSLKKPERKP